MTREEARQGLQGYSLLIADGTDLKEALNIAIEALQAEAVQDGEPCPFCGGKGRIRRILDIDHDVVQVVRCKDCRWWNSETKGCKRNPSVKAWQEDDFCKYGKRWSNAID